MAAIFRQITICGVGLIGGSLGQRARRDGLVQRVVGFGRRAESLKLALERGLVDEVTTDPRQAASGAELVVLASPLLAMPELAGRLMPFLPADAIVSDVGSVKRWVVEQLEALLGPAMALVAAHPVAGKETAGPGAADAELFSGRRVIITPSARTTAAALARVAALWRATGALVEEMEPAAHDRILAHASHLPQVVSSALGVALAQAQVEGRYVAAYGAGGLRDTSRLARSPADIWRDICLTNREAILEAMGRYEQALAGFRRAIERADAGQLEAEFTAAHGIARHLDAPARRPRPIVALDGPVGAGKSTVARALARELGFDYLNTGAMYRVVALAARRAGIGGGAADLVRLERLLQEMRIEFAGERVLLDGEDVSEAIAAPEIGDLASTLSTLTSVRARLRDLQRQAGAQGGVVMEGRDIGTAVFPDAEVKFYLDAAPAVRAARRHAELVAKGHAVSQAQVLAQLLERDRRDSTRAIAPLRCAEDAIVVDCTHLTVAEVVDHLKTAIKRQLGR
jgi:prephenate dehydrogenase